MIQTGRRNRGSVRCEPIESRILFTLYGFGLETTVDREISSDQIPPLDVGTLAAPVVVGAPENFALLVGDGTGGLIKYYRSGGMYAPYRTDTMLYGGAFLGNYNTSLKVPVDANMGMMPDLVHWQTGSNTDIIAGDPNGTIHLFLQSTQYADTPVQLESNPGTYSKPRAVDWNHDGMMDLLVGVVGDNVVYLNTGTPEAQYVPAAPAFDAPAIRLGIGFAGQNSSDFADLDHDGLPDLVVAGGTSCRFYKNVGTLSSPKFDGTFTTLFDDAAAPITRLSVGNWSGSHGNDLVYGTTDGHVYWRKELVPTVSAENAAPMLEGDSGTRNMSFTIRLSRPAETLVTAGWQYGWRTDSSYYYNYWTNQVEFAPGETVKTVTVPIEGDTTIEADQTIILKVTGGNGAEPSDFEAQGIVIDDDGPQAAIAVAGNGVSISNNDSSPAKIDGTNFGAVVAGSPDGPLHDFTVTNTGDKAMWIGQITLPAGFGLVNTLSSVIQPGESSTLSIRLLPDAGGVHSGDITIANSSGSPVDGQLTPAVFKFAVSGRVIGTDCSMVGVADMNRDGTADLIWRVRATSENFVQYLDHDAKVIDTASLPQASPTWCFAGLADFDGDHDMDLVWRNSRNGANRVWYTQGTRVASQGVLPTVADRNMVIAGVADFTGDTRPDILWHNNKTGVNSFWRLKGVSILKSSIPTFATPARSEIAAIGDLNHDGKADILWRDAKTGTATAWYMNRTARASTAVLSALASIRGYEVMIGRITADDGNILCRRISTGATRIWSLSGITPVSASILS